MDVFMFLSGKNLYYMRNPDFWHAIQIFEKEVKSASQVENDQDPNQKSLVSENDFTDQAYIDFNEFYSYLKSHGLVTHAWKVSKQMYKKNSSCLLCNGCYDA